MGRWQKPAGAKGFASGEHAQMRDKVREGDKVQEGNKVRVRDSATRDSMRWTKVRWFRPVKGKIVGRFYLPNYYKKAIVGWTLSLDRGKRYVQHVVEPCTFLVGLLTDM